MYLNLFAIVFLILLFIPLVYRGERKIHALNFFIYTPFEVLNPFIFFQLHLCITIVGGILFMLFIPLHMFSSYFLQ